MSTHTTIFSRTPIALDSNKLKSGNIHRESSLERGVESCWSSKSAASFRYKYVANDDDRKEWKSVAPVLSRFPISSACLSKQFPKETVASSSLYPHEMSSIYVVSIVLVGFSVFAFLNKFRFSGKRMEVKQQGAMKGEASEASKRKKKGSTTKRKKAKKVPVIEASTASPLHAGAEELPNNNLQCSAEVHHSVHSFTPGTFSSSPNCIDAFEGSKANCNVCSVVTDNLLNTKDHNDGEWQVVCRKAIGSRVKSGSPRPRLHSQQPIVPELHSSGMRVTAAVAPWKFVSRVKPQVTDSSKSSPVFDKTTSTPVKQVHAVACRFKESSVSDVFSPTQGRGRAVQRREEWRVKERHLPLLVDQKTAQAYVAKKTAGVDSFLEVEGISRRMVVEEGLPEHCEAGSCAALDAVGIGGTENERTLTRSSNDTSDCSANVECTNSDLPLTLSQSDTKVMKLNSREVSAKNESENLTESNVIHRRKNAQNCRDVVQARGSPREVVAHPTSPRTFRTQECLADAEAKVQGQTEQVPMDPANGTGHQRWCDMLDSDASDTEHSRWKDDFKAINRQGCERKSQKSIDLPWRRKDLASIEVLEAKGVPYLDLGQSLLQEQADSKPCQESSPKVDMVPKRRWLSRGEQFSGRKNRNRSYKVNRHDPENDSGINDRMGKNSLQSHHNQRPFQASDYAGQSMRNTKIHHKKTLDSGVTHLKSDSVRSSETNTSVCLSLDQLAELRGPAAFRDFDTKSHTTESTSQSSDTNSRINCSLHVSPLATTMCLCQSHDDSPQSPMPFSNSTYVTSASTKTVF